MNTNPRMDSSNDISGSYQLGLRAGRRILRDCGRGATSSIAKEYRRGARFAQSGNWRAYFLGLARGLGR